MFSMASYNIERTDTIQFLTKQSNLYDQTEAVDFS